MWALEEPLSGAVLPAGMLARGEGGETQDENEAGGQELRAKVGETWEVCRKGILGFLSGISWAPLA